MCIRDSVEAWSGCTITWYDLRSPAEKQALRRLSSERYQALVSELGGSDSALVLTTGPSIDSVDLEALGREHEVRVACNSIVGNPEMLAALKPNVFAFGDAAFHFGPSRYAAKFRSDFRSFLETQDPWVITPVDMYPLLEREFPEELLARVVPVEYRRTLPDGYEGAVPLHVSHGNVMTSLMLPTASFLADRISMAGCDGRSPDDHGFWSHSKAAQYDDLYRTVVDSHPSFFDDANYVAYYERHCGVLDGEVSRLLEQGKQLQMKTPSYIPALSMLPGGSPQ